jgi:hypothetical protein
MTVATDGARRRLFAHALAFCWFSVLAIAISYPLVLNLGTHIPGAGAGDNVAFLWNFWWFRYALAEPGAAFFFTDHLFAPFGTSLVLHTHTALQAMAGATFFRGASVVHAHNLLLLAGLAANGALAYALAFQHARQVLPAVLAGTIFAASAWMSIRLLGHFNLVHAWVLPLGLLTWIRCARAPTAARGAAVAAAFAAAAYTDYYYLVFALIACAAYGAADAWRIGIDRIAPRSRLLSRLLVAVMIAIGLLILAVLATGGFRFNIGPMGISASSIRNPLAGLWLLAIVWAALRLRLTVKPRGAVAVERYAPAVTAGLILWTIAALPLAAPAVGLLLSGDYVSPPQLWRSGPRGIDLLTLVAGNPLNSVYGSLTRAAYARAGIDVMEQTAWLGLVPLIVLTARAVRGGERDPASRPWLGVAALFLVWATGAYLMVGGMDTGQPTPQILTRFIPILSNARIPGRAIVVVQLAAAVLCAGAVKRLGWRKAVLFTLIILTVADGSAAPIRLYELPRPGPIESALARGTPNDAIVELPMGLRDGLGEVGHMDHRALVFQMDHQRPMAGGFVARLSPHIRRAVEETPELLALLKLSSAGADERAEDLPQDLVSGLLAARITHVVVNTDSMPMSVREAFESRGLRLTAVSGSRELYLVGGGS